MFSRAVVSVGGGGRYNRGGKICIVLQATLKVSHRAWWSRWIVAGLSSSDSDPGPRQLRETNVQNVLASSRSYQGGSQKILRDPSLVFLCRRNLRTTRTCRRNRRRAMFAETVLSGRSCVVQREDRSNNRVGDLHLIVGTEVNSRERR